MDPAPAAPPPRPWVAGLLALLFPGAGHAHAGRPRAGVLVVGLQLAAVLALVWGIRAGPVEAAAGLAFAIVFTAGQVLSAARSARSAGPPAGSRSRRVAILVAFLAASVTVGQLAKWLREHVASTAYVPSGSMIPGLQVGDVFAVRHGVAPRRGSVVMHAAPAGAVHGADLVKRVVGVAGDTVEVRGGGLVLNGEPVPRERSTGSCTYWTKLVDGPWREERCIDFVEMLGERRYHTYCSPDVPCDPPGSSPAQRVPPGHVFVVGDHRDHSADSRVYGPVPLEDLRGEAVYVLLSFGPHGVRWERIGRPVD